MVGGSNLSVSSYFMYLLVILFSSIQVIERVGNIYLQLFCWNLKLYTPVVKILKKTSVLNPSSYALDIAAFAQVFFYFFYFRLIICFSKDVTYLSTRKKRACLKKSMIRESRTWVYRFDQSFIDSMQLFLSLIQFTRKSTYLTEISSAGK